MSNPTRTTPPTGPEAVLASGFEPMFALSTALVANLAQWQRMQLDAWLSWQKAMTGNGQELYDEWACRFGGGVPIDG